MKTLKPCLTRLQAEPFLAPFLTLLLRIQHITKRQRKTGGEK